MGSLGHGVHVDFSARRLPRPDWVRRSGRRRPRLCLYILYIWLDESPRGSSARPGTRPSCICSRRRSNSTTSSPLRLRLQLALQQLTGKRLILISLPALYASENRMILASLGAPTLNLHPYQDSIRPTGAATTPVSSCCHYHRPSIRLPEFGIDPRPGCELTNPSATHRVHVQIACDLES